MTFWIILENIFNLFNLLNWHLRHEIWINQGILILEVIFEHLSCQYLRYLALSLIATVIKTIFSLLERKLFTKHGHPWPFKGPTDGLRTVRTILKGQRTIIEDYYNSLNPGPQQTLLGSWIVLELFERIDFRVKNCSESVKWHATRINITQNNRKQSTWNIIFLLTKYYSLGFL